MLMVFDRDTFVIHMLYFPHKFVGSLRKDQTHLATTCFGTLIHHPIAHIGTIGITYWDSNPYLPDLESGVLPIKLRLHIMVRAVRFERTITSTQNWWINQTFPRPHILWKRVWDSNPRKTLLMPLPVFKTGVFNRSTNPPKFLGNHLYKFPMIPTSSFMCMMTTT